MALLTTDQVPHRLAAPYAEFGGERVGAGEPVETDQTAGGGTPLFADAFGVAGEGERLLQFRPGHHRAPALPAQPAFQQQLAQSLADRLARDLGAGCEVTFGRQLSAFTERRSAATGGP